MAHLSSAVMEKRMHIPAFRGKVALITVGTAGIGKAAAHLFAQAGAYVVIAGRRVDKGRQTEQELQAAGATALCVQADVSEPEQVAACIAKTVEQFGRLDYAFNNAAALGKLGRTGDFTPEDFDLEVSNNLKSIWLCMKAELEQMERQEMPGGVIVNTSSVNGLGGARGAAPYSIRCGRRDLQRKEGDLRARLFYLRWCDNCFCDT